MRDYLRHQRKRDPLVWELSQLGLTIPEIATSTGWGSSTIALDLRKHGGVKSLRKRPLGKDEVFLAVLRRYAALAFEKPNDTNDLWRILRNHEYIRMLRAFVEGAAALQLTLKNIGVVLDKGYRELIKAIFNEPMLFDELSNSNKEVVLAEEYFESFLERVRAGDVPTSATEARWRLAQIVRGQLRLDDIVVARESLAERLTTAIETALRQLTPRQGVVIRMRFGIGHEPMTQVRIGKNPGFLVTRERIRQIERRAIEKLRHPSRADPIRRCIERLNDPPP